MRNVVQRKRRLLFDLVPTGRRRSYGARRFALVALVAAGLSLAACGSTHSAAAGKSATASTHDKGKDKGKDSDASAQFLTPEMTYGTATYGAPNPGTTIPTERGSRPISATNDAGQQIIIAEHGELVPELLIADAFLPITWTNLSGQPQQVVFDSGGVVSKIIPYEGTFVWTSPGYAVSFRYHVVGGSDAEIQLQNPNTPGLS